MLAYSYVVAQHTLQWFPSICAVFSAVRHALCAMRMPSNLLWMQLSLIIKFPQVTDFGWHYNSAKNIKKALFTAT